MLKIGFHENWVTFLLKCVNSILYRVCINDGKGEQFYPTRGLRQGDSLSLYLFLICVEGLSTLMRKAREEK